MAREPERKGGIFGGRRSLKEDLQDTSGNERVGFEDTWLGDVLGFDGSIGTSGPGLRESWRGARRRRAEPVDPDAARRRAAAARAGERAAQDELRTTLAERPSYYRLADGDGLRDPGSSGAPISEVTVTPLVPGTGKTLDEILAQPVEGTVQSDVAPRVGDTAPTMGSPSVGSPVGVEAVRQDTAPSLVQRPTMVATPTDVRPTIETSTTYPLRSTIETLLGPRSQYVLTRLPSVMDAILTNGSQNDLKSLKDQINGLPDTDRKQEVLDELNKMADSLRGGGGGY